MKKINNYFKMIINLDVLELIKRIINDVFFVSLITFFCYLGCELMFEGIISNYFDLNIILIIVLVSGFFIFFSSPINTKEKKRNSVREIHLLVKFFFAIIMALVIYFKLQVFSYLSFFVAVFGGVIIYFVFDKKTYD